MRSFEAPDGTRFHYNSDFSGDVIIERESGDARISGDALLAFVAKAFCLPAKISLLEDIGADSKARIDELSQAEPQALLMGIV